MEETIIPWDFPGMLIVLGLLVQGIILCVHALKTISRAWLQYPRKDHIYKNAPPKPEKSKNKQCPRRCIYSVVK